MSVTDTTPEAAELQLRLLKAAGTAARATMAAELSDAVRETALAGIRRRHPELTEHDVSRSFLALVYRHGTDR
jgi:hypothetical protein